MANREAWEYVAFYDGALALEMAQSHRATEGANRDDQQRDIRAEATPPTTSQFARSLVTARDESSRMNGLVGRGLLDTQ